MAPINAIVSVDGNTTVGVGDIILFNASSSRIGLHLIKNYSTNIAPVYSQRVWVIWDFDDRDGISGDSFDINATHKYATAGIYQVALIIIVAEIDTSNDRVFIDKDTITITVVE